MALGVFVGLLVPPLASVARPLLTPAMFCVLTLSLLRLDLAAVGQWLRRPVVLLLLLIWMLVATPVLAATILATTPLDRATQTAFILFAAAPPITVIPAYAMLLGTNAALATVVLTLASIAAPIVLPLVAIGVIGLELEISGAAFAARLLALIGGSFLAAAILRSVIGRQRIDASGSQISAFVVIAMLVLALSIMDGVTAQLLADPIRVIAFAGGVVAANIILQTVTAGVFWKLGRTDSLTAGLTGGYRNSILLLAVLGTAASPELSLMAASAQIAVYILPAVQQPLFRALGCRAI